MSSWTNHSSSVSATGSDESEYIDIDGRDFESTRLGGRVSVARYGSVNEHDLDFTAQEEDYPTKREVEEWDGMDMDMEL